VLIDDAGTAPAAGQAKVRVVHGAPAVPNVDIFVTAPNDALPATPTIANLAFAGQAPAAGSARGAAPALAGATGCALRISSSSEMDASCLSIFASSLSQSVMPARR
jgi:hypothetical protein